MDEGDGVVLVTKLPPPSSSFRADPMVIGRNEVENPKAQRS